MDTRTLAVIGILALAAFLFLGAHELKLALRWAAILLVTGLVIWLSVKLIRYIIAKRKARALEQDLENQAQKSVKKVAPAKRAEVEALRGRLTDAIKKIKTSRLGVTTGAAALYELPWYMVIGNPAAGKSSAIVNSGLQFPFADGTGKIIQGIGGTRNCDWFFTSSGILLDTAGRYSVHEEDRDEWMGFLNLLKKHRPKAPINGLIVAVSVAELINAKPDATIELAKKLRQRVQELTEKLEIFAPLYLVFTKCDLVSGFVEFFEDRDRAERDHVWGTTLPYDPEGRQDAQGAFDTHFNELYEGLKEASVARMSLARGQSVPPGVLTFPVEFMSMKAALRSFVATLFEDNPYQFRPVFRGFYFTSALQEGGESTSQSSARVAQMFGLELKQSTASQVFASRGFFLRDLFAKVIFADKALVRRYASRTKLQLRYASFFAGVALLGLVLAGWTWSYVGNRQLVSNVRADLEKVIKLQEKSTELQSRLEALNILQDRIEQLEAYKEARPWSISLGLYQGESLEKKLRAEYYNGIKEVMLRPVAGSIESYLNEVNANADKLDGNKPMNVAGASANAPTVAGQYTTASVTSVQDAYNALKTYLMLADQQRFEIGHLSDQITRFWRGWLEVNRGSMPRDTMIRSAERVITFYLSQSADPTLPLIENNLTVVDQTRENLRRVVRGTPARERVYADVKARAATRFPPMTVARIVGDQDREIVVGSYAIPGAFTREAWDNYIKEAFKDAANKELQSSDWVLKIATRDDLTLEGSPEQIEKALIGLYKTEYVREWQKFLQGVSIEGFSSFEQAVTRMNRLGDPQLSPINKVLTSLYDNTSWDNPSLINERLAKAQTGIIAWFKQLIMGGVPSQANVNVNVGAAKMEIPMGPIGKEFAGVARLMLTRDGSPTLLRGYMETLSKIRTRLNQVRNQGDPGPASRQLIQQTLEGQGELADALRFIDEQMLTGMTDSARASLRPLLVRPLMQAFASAVPPAESEVNRVWAAQVYEPFSRSLANKYPFAADARVEAGSAEIAQIFGPDGAISKFSQSTLGPLVVRRGDLMTARTWADMGIQLAPEFTANFGIWVAALDASGTPQAPAAGGGSPQTVFQLQPQPTPGLTEYTVDIDGQVLRYRNTASEWVNFVWPGQGVAGARITGLTFDGRSIEIVNQPGRFGLERLVNSAQRRKLDNGVFELSWQNGNTRVALNLRVISQAGENAASGPRAPGFRGMRLPAAIAGSPGGAAAQTSVQPGSALNAAPNTAPNSGASMNPAPAAAVGAPNASGASGARVVTQ